ncbi:hypothetical protein TBLA_0F01600 [Henningerozyma blattae CBS 6284]|uniref:Major facilitator superfamily (MFS) profile domain-containing protein n=1 Tax=Henningerozyma blattae (strain ATCC 34711 / CBS 6284 / DSM 70876 / NBRC 10599 / NRRL Y-10934 / UCD 77-7) TaxID=1071380 RepID=I2H5Q0_HENB6|nr:hypothetical protein TBLA_0F01600 [Tetrapisispora blattae CBS 6284]CCH61702.1 hypothetical protein TBLA_0F01600 [Tetrapisispora blattae CBS 6284]
MVQEDIEQPILERNVATENDGSTDSYKRYRSATKIEENSFGTKEEICSETREVSTVGSISSEKPTDIWKYTTVCLMCIMVAFGGFMMGWDIGTIGGFMAQTDFIQRFGTKNEDGVLYLSTIRMGLLVSIFNIGCAIGSVFLGKLGDLYGRRWGLIFGTSIFVVGVIIQIASVSKWFQYFIGRIIAGIGMGVIAVLSPMLISEVAPKELRGAMVSCYQLMITFGIFLGNCCNYGTKSYQNSKQWRIAVGLQFLWCIIMVSGMTFVPESPRYLVQQNMFEEAKESIAISNKLSKESEETLQEFEIVKAGIQAELDAGEAQWKELFHRKNKILQRVLMGIFVLGLQQLTGANYFFYYGATVFKSVGLDDSFQTTIIFGVVNFLSTFVSLYVVDRFGRRFCLLVGSAALGLCMLVFATVGVTSLYSGDSDVPSCKWAGNVMIVVSCIYIFFFATTWAPVPFVILSETFPTNIKSKGMALGIVSNQLWNFVIGFCTPWITKSIHFYYGYIFLGCCVFAFLYVFFFVPETKGLGLDDINTMWEEETYPWRSSSWIPPSQRAANNVIEEPEVVA